MLHLTPDQLAALEQVVRTRLAARLQALFAELWPAMTERLGERAAAFIDAALAQAGRAGLREPLACARYANLWFIWGPSFEDRPGGEWAREILDAPQRTPELRLHQLVMRSREELQRRAPQPGQVVAPGAAPVVDAAAFDTAETQLGQALAETPGLTVCAIDPSAPRPLRLPACDAEQIDVAILDTAWRQVYRPGPLGWVREAPSLPAPRLRIDSQTMTQGGGAPAAPLIWATLGPPAPQQPAARLAVKLQPQAVCDAAVHPALSWSGLAGARHWRGPAAQLQAMPLYGPAAQPVEPQALTPVIAAESGPERYQLQLATCGVRHAGAPVGSWGAELAVYPAEQWLQELRLPAWVPQAWPEEAAPAAPAVAVRLERDGHPWPAAAWTNGWQGLHAAFRQGMEALLAAWSRTAQVEQPRLEVSPQLLTGQAGVSWGYHEDFTAGPAVPPAAALMRVAAQFDLVGCALELSLSGLFDWQGAQARVRLSASGAAPLRAAVLREMAQPALPEAIGPLSVSFRFPFRLDVEPLAGPTLAVLSPAAPASGALVGACGLRPRVQGNGLQWFCTLRVEPVAAPLTVADPVLGQARLPRAWLPALTVLDWKLG